MSCLLLRNAVRADWPRLLPNLRFVETINRALPVNPPLPLPDVWGTLGFTATSRRPVTMGADPWIVETGFVSFIVLARSGHGDTAGITACDEIIRAWSGWESPTGAAWFSTVGAPQQLEEQADGNWHMFTVAAPYEAQFRETSQ